MNREPTLVITAIGVFLSAITKAAVLLEIVDWDTAQLAAISLVIDSGLVVIGALIVRDRVTPVSAPHLPVGTTVNESLPGPNSTVVEDAAPAPAKP